MAAPDITIGAGGNTALATNKNVTEATKYHCVHCLTQTSTLYRQFSPTSLKLTVCPTCHNDVDPYVEREDALVLLDLVLWRPPAYRHVLLNGRGIRWLQDDDSDDTCTIGGTKSSKRDNNSQTQGQNCNSTRISQRCIWLYLVGAALLHAHLLWHATQTRSRNSSHSSMAMDLPDIAQLLSLFGHVLVNLCICAGLCYIILRTSSPTNGSTLSQLLPACVFLAMVLPEYFGLVTTLVMVWEVSTTVHLLGTCLILFYQAMALWTLASVQGLHLLSMVGLIGVTSLARIHTEVLLLTRFRPWQWVLAGLDYSSEPLWTTIASTAAVLIVASFSVYCCYHFLWLHRSVIPNNGNGRQPLHVVVWGAGAIGTVIGCRLSQEINAPLIEKVLLVGRQRLRTALAEGSATDETDESNEGDNGRNDNRCIRIRTAHGRNEIYPVGPGKRLQAIFDTQESSVLTDLLVASTNKNHGRVVILVTCKTMDTQIVADQLASALPTPSRAVIFSLQNGLHTKRVLRKTLEKTHPGVVVLAGVVAFPAHWETSHYFLPLSKGGCILERPSDLPYESSRLGNKDDLPQVSDTVNIMTKALRQANLVPSYATTRIVRLKCAKLLVNLLNPLTALSGMTVPQTLRHAGYRRVWAASLQEGAKVLSSSCDTAEGGRTLLITIVLGRLVPWALLSLPNAIFSVCIPDNKYYSSMWEDLRDGRSVTEIDDLSGVLVKLAQHDEMVPVNLSLIRLVKEAQEAGKGSPRISPSDLLNKIGMAS